MSKKVKVPKPFYITTTLPYVNADPHVGFAAEIIRADAVARYRKLVGQEIFFNTGTDEHGQKVWTEAGKQNKNPQEYVDEYAQKFIDLLRVLDISEEVHFTRTTSEAHKKAAKYFWKVCADKGDIYKKEYKIKYCVGCELEKQDSDLDEGDKCLVHPHLELEIREEENYFFKFSNYQKPLLELYEKNPNLVIPDFRFNEIKKFVEMGLHDFSISRLKSKMPWGVEVPGDSDHVMYVWFDALVNSLYFLFQKFWQEGETVQYCGKDNLRQQSAMWQAMLLSVGLKNTDHIVINGFINSGGQKMSKSLGNVISPFDLVSEYSTDALRYYSLRELSNFEDSDMTIEKFKEAYNANLANGLGNLASRVLTLSQKYLDKCPEIPEESDFVEYFKFYENFDLNGATNYVWNEIGKLDKFIQETEPFKVVKVDEVKGRELISKMVQDLYTIARMLNPIMPATNVLLKKLIKENKAPETPLFPRKN